jgi:adenine-specific DNA-methyltransferase
VTILHELLAESGSIYVHLDYHVSHYAKAILDEVFGSEHFQNEIIWKRQSAHSAANRFGPIHDTILFVSKSDEFTWNQQFEPLSQEYIEGFFTNIDADGRHFARGDLTGSGRRTYLEYEWRGHRPKAGRHWAVPMEKLEEYFKQGKIFFPKDGMPRLKRYPEDSAGVPAQDIWTNIKLIHNQSTERLDYPTQKPEALLDRILRASSNDNDLILDCFCGSGTTAAVAEKLNRRWIACDLGRFAVHTTRKRLLNIENVRPFVVQNLGKYERQQWQTGTFAPDGPETPEQAAKRNQAYIDFMLRLYGGRPVAGRALLHGVKNGRLVHVGGVDAPVSDGDIRQIAAEFKRSMGTGKDAPTSNGVDVLGWDFAFEVNEVARQQAERANVNLRFLRIPRDVMDKRAVDQGDVKFFELAALDVAVKAKRLDVALSLSGFVIPPDDVPEEVRKAVTHWSQWIDYWAVDWDHGGDAFHNEWQTFRTRKQTKLAPAATHTYEKAGEYNVMVKVIDILGNDTTKTVKINVK